MQPLGSPSAELSPLCGGGQDFTDINQHRQTVTCLSYCYVSLKLELCVQIETLRIKVGQVGRPGQKRWNVLIF